jgi:glycosyltransferase involved in cell wall biosynthesis
MKQRLFGKLVSSTRLSRIIVNSHALKHNVATNFPDVKDRLLLARNGADPAPPDRGQPLPVRRRDKQMMVGYVGHLYPGRGMEILRELAQLCPWADFHIVGGWPDDVAFWRGLLGSLANTFLHGHVPPSEVPHFLRAFDVLIAPYQPVVTLRGGAGNNTDWVCPLKLFEYMAAGKPIVCSDLPILREVLSHEKTALLCAPTKVEQWAEALRQLRDHKQLADVIATGALEKFIQCYSWDARAALVLDGITHHS